MKMIFGKNSLKLRDAGHWPGILFSAVCMVWLAVKLYKMFATPEARVIFEGFFAHTGLLVAAVLLMPLNVLTEGLKWNAAIHKIRPGTLRRSVGDVLTGMTAGFITPHAVGDYLGRTAGLTMRQRLPALPAVMLCRWSQLLITIVAGVACTFLMPIKVEWPRYWLYLSVAGAGSLLLIIYFFYRSIVSHFLFRRVLRGFSLIAGNAPGKIVAFSAVRYFIFFVQYVLIIKVFVPGAAVPDVAVCVPVVFLLKSVVPSYNFFSDLGIREWAAVSVFTAASGYPESPVIAASLTVWLINTAGPVAGGLLWIWLRRKYGESN